MNRAEVVLLSFRCVTHLYVQNFIELLPKRMNSGNKRVPAKSFRSKFIRVIYFFPIFLFRLCFALFMHILQYKSATQGTITKEQIAGYKKVVSNKLEVNTKPQTKFCLYEN